MKLNLPIGIGTNLRPCRGIRVIPNLSLSYLTTGRLFLE